MTHVISERKMASLLSLIARKALRLPATACCPKAARKMRFLALMAGAYSIMHPTHGLQRISVTPLRRDVIITKTTYCFAPTV